MRLWRPFALQTWAVLFLGLAATVAAALSIASAERDRRQAIFSGISDSVVTAVQSRMSAQLGLLRGTAGLFNASREVTRDEFHNFVERLRLKAYYPGVLGIGFSAYAPDRKSAEAMVAKATSAGGPQFQLWPKSERSAYSAIIYLEPLNRLNREALGYDMLSQSVRRAAMVQARDNAGAVLSGKVRLVQEIDPVKQPGFLVYVPLYRRSPASASASAATGTGTGTDLYGWVYSPLRAYDFFGPLFGNLEDVDVEIFDGKPIERNLLYRRGRVQAEPVHLLARSLEIAHHRWTVRVSSTASFDRRSPLVLGGIVFISGALITLLLTMLMDQQRRAAERIERQVEDRTSELLEANSNLRLEAAARAGAEAQVRQMQKIEAVGQLTGGIAHDFNNMLAVIIGNLDLALRRFDQPERAKRGIANAQIGAEKAAELTSRLLAFGRRQALTPRAVDVNALVSGMSDLLRRTLGKSIELKTVLDEDLWPVFADPVQLESAILNLSINSRDSMASGGSLKITTANCHFDESEARARDEISPGDYVRVSVADTGSGMPAEVAARAIEPFFTTKVVGKGTGLGLSQVYGFTRQSGGHLEIRSESKRGTSVAIHLPRSLGELAGDSEARAGAADTPGARDGEAILLVEDEDQLREVNSEALRDLGYRVIDCASGAQALAVVDSEERIDLLFTDVVMPGMNGRELAEEAARIRPLMPVLFTTGFTSDSIIPEDGLGDKRGLLLKPFPASELARQVRELIDR